VFCIENECGDYYGAVIALSVLFVISVIIIIILLLRPGAAELSYYSNIIPVFNIEYVTWVWNNLPESVDFSTLASFTRTTKTVDFSKYLTYSWQFTIFSVFFLLVSVFYCF